MEGPDAATSGRRHDVEHAIQHGRLGSVDDVFANEIDCQEDDLSVLAGLRVAIPVGLAIWALVIWSIVHFLF